MDAQAAIEEVFRRESGRIIATLIRVSGSFDRAEEAVQEAFASALVFWERDGIPKNPGAWITTVAHRKLIDEARRERTKREKQDALRYETESADWPQEPAIQDEMRELPDDRLRLMFTCCHPALNQEAQVALTLRTLGGLTTSEIAKAFLVPEPTLAQRLVRAKRKIQEARIPYQVPPAHVLPERLASVQAAVYLIFNEGYVAATGDRLVRGDLCREAIRLGRLLCELLPEEPENLGLLALMLLHDSRRKARVSDGRLVTLEQQDRALWDEGEISEGLALVERALASRQPGPYQIQAAIAAIHGQAKTAGETDWAEIAALYEALLATNRTPVIALNHAVAVALSGRLEEGLENIDELGAAGGLDGYYLFHAARADILRRMNRFAQAEQSYKEALRLTTNTVEREFLELRLESVRSESRS